MNFKYGHEGTSIDDFITIIEKNEFDLIVFEKAGSYGTTCRIEDLENTEKIKNLQIVKCSDHTIQIELYPRVFLHIDDNLNKLEEYDTFQSIYWIEIRNHILITEEYKIYKIPYNDYDIVTAKWMNPIEKKLWYLLVHKKIDFDTFEKEISKECYNIMQSIILREKSKNNIPIYLKTFGSTPFYYPMYGEKEVSDQMSRILAFKNIAFYVDKDLTVTKKNKRYELMGTHGKAEFEVFLTKNKTAKEKKYVKVCLLNHKFLKKKFFGTYKIKQSLIFIISLDSTTRICSKDTFLLYIYSFDPLPVNIKEKLRIAENTVINEINFKTNT